MDWKIYYSDGNTHSSLDDGKPPPLDCQVIVMLDKDHGWLTQTGSDYYVWDDRGGGARWWGVDLFGLFEYLMRSGLVLFGRTITSDEFHKIFKRACDDPEMPQKTAFRRRERKP